MAIPENVWVSRDPFEVSLRLSDRRAQPDDLGDSILVPELPRFYSAKSSLVRI
jgi:hypothetical protein